MGLIRHKTDRPLGVHGGVRTISDFINVTSGAPRVSTPGLDLARTRSRYPEWSREHENSGLPDGRDNQSQAFSRKIYITLKCMSLFLICSSESQLSQNPSSKRMQIFSNSGPYLSAFGAAWRFWAGNAASMVSVRSGRGMGPVKRISHVEARPHKVLSFCW